MENTSHLLYIEKSDLDNFPLTFICELATNELYYFLLFIFPLILSAKCFSILL